MYVQFCVEVDHKRVYKFCVLDFYLIITNSAQLIEVVKLYLTDLAEI
jgi:hypothetical protein